MSKKNKKQDSSSSLINWAIGILALIALVMVVMLIGAVLKMDKGESATNNAPVVQEENKVYLGDADAPNELIYVFDYSCPWCSTWVDDMLPELNELIEDGELKLSTQSIVLLDTVSGELAKFDENVKDHYPEHYFDILGELIMDSTEIAITNDYLADLVGEYDLDSSVLFEDPEADVIELTELYQEEYDVEYVPSVILNGELIEDSFDVEYIRSVVEAEA